MIKICYIIGQLVRDGAERQLYELLRGIDRKIFLPTVISLSKGGFWADEIRKLSIEVIELERKKSFEFARLIKLTKIIKKFKPVIVHTSAKSANYYGRFAAILNRVPVIITSERSSVNIGITKSKSQIHFEKLLLKFTDAIICNSDNASTTLIDNYFFPLNKVYTIHNGIDGQEYVKDKIPNKSLNNGKKIIGTIGRLYDVKNYEYFLDTAKIILDKSKKSQIEFCIVGDGPLREELQNYCVNLQIQNYIKFYGERADVANILDNFNIFVMTSKTEGLSNAIMEAMLMELAVVATDVGGNRELIIDEKTGFLGPVNNAKILADKVLQLIENDRLANTMGKNGRTRILKQFSIEKMVNKTQNLYFSLLDDAHLN